VSSDRYRLAQGYFFVLAATAIWSGNFIVARVLANTVPPMTLVVLRCATAVVVIIPFAIGPLYRERSLVVKHLGYLAIMAFLGVTVCQTTVYVAAATSEALNLSLIAICSPVLTVSFARLFLKDTLSPRRVWGLIAATLGVILLITQGQLSRLIHMTFSAGDLWMLGQAASFAVYSILLRKMPEKLSPATFLFSIFVLGMIFVLPGVAWELDAIEGMRFSPEVVGAIIYLGVGPSLLSYLCWTQSVAIIGPSRSALVYYCLPLFSGVEAFLFLGETIQMIHILSGILILTGVIVATKE